MNEKTIRFKSRMSDIENELKPYSFIRCHIGFLVNCRFIKICSRTSITLITGQVIPISRAKAEETQNKSYFQNVNCHFKIKVHGRKLLIYFIKIVCVSSALARLIGIT